MSLEVLSIVDTSPVPFLEVQAKYGAIVIDLLDSFIRESGGYLPLYVRVSGSAEVRSRHARRKGSEIVEFPLVGKYSFKNELVEVDADDFKQLCERETITTRIFPNATFDSRKYDIPRFNEFIQTETDVEFGLNDCYLDGEFIESFVEPYFEREKIPRGSGRKKRVQARYDRYRHGMLRLAIRKTEDLLTTTGLHKKNVMPILIRDYIGERKSSPLDQSEFAPRRDEKTRLHSLYEKLAENASAISEVVKEGVPAKTEAFMRHLLADELKYETEEFGETI